MRVRELIEMLEDCEPDAEVLVMSQENWPFEGRVHGVVERRGFGVRGDDAMDPKEPVTTEGSPSDVFIVEGNWVRYGSKDAWAAARTCWRARP